MNSLLSNVVKSCSEGEIAFSKYITANDVGQTGGHQSGYHIHKNAWKLFFNEPGEKGENRKKCVKINWYDYKITESVFTYYGKGTRNEYRLTKFGRGFPFLCDNNIGDLLVLVRIEDEYYHGFILSKDEDIDDFLLEMGMTPLQTNAIIPKRNELSVEEKLYIHYKDYINSLTEDFPKAIEMSDESRRMYNEVNRIGIKNIKSNPDKEILAWITAEYNLFKELELDRYSEFINKPFGSVDDLVLIANSILNRRKSRAGKSLENHLAYVFRSWELEFESQPITEGNKKPDFIFPNISLYNSEPIGSNKLVFLGAKTTCKDRWRQIVGEADKIPIKYLFTLQQGISKNQLMEMEESGVKLVVPLQYIKSFPDIFQEKITSLKNFLIFVQHTQRQ